MLNHGHGGDIKAFATSIGCKIEEVIDLSSNINFVKPKRDINFNHLNISAYPNYDKLYQAIANLYKVKISQMELFNGATTAIYALLRTLDLSHATLYSPCYLEYKKALELYGYQINQINRLDGFSAKSEDKIKENSLVVFVNPSTPDGKFYPIEEQMQIWIEKGCTILIDESFLDFTPFESATKYLDYPKLYILKSMTKFYSSAGIRIGAMVSTEQNINTLQKSEPLWKISEFDSHYLQSALRDSSFVEKSQELNCENRDFLIKMLKNSSLIEKVYDSSSNFVMVKLKTMDAKIFQERLNPYKIMIRNCDNFDFLDSSFVRIAVKEMGVLKILKSLL